MNSNNLLQKVKGKLKQYSQKLDIVQRIYNTQRKKQHIIVYKGKRFIFSVPNSLCEYRAESFATKEPETLDWIDNFEELSVFWDIGANVGLYSIYAASRGCSVFAFEPSVFNLELLARNVHLNKLAEKVAILPVALSDNPGFGMMNMSSTEMGGALSTFDKAYGFDGKPLNIIFSYRMLSLTGNEAVEKLNIPYPDHIKIDVDGIEHLILAGADIVLKKIKSILIEVSRDFEDQQVQIYEMMDKAGLTLAGYTAEEKKRFHILENAATTNLIWKRI